MWRPSQSNGWNPRLSLVNGRLFVLYGLEGSVFLAELRRDLTAITETPIAGLVLGQAQCYAAGWIEPHIACWVSDQGAAGWAAAQLNVLSRIVIWTPASPLFEGNSHAAGGGHLIAWLALVPNAPDRSFRLSLDGSLLQQPAGGAIALTWPWFCCAETNDNRAIVRYRGGVRVDQVSVGTALHAATIDQHGRLLYGGHGDVWIDYGPGGLRGSAAITPDRDEGPIGLIGDGGIPFVVTVNAGAVLIRPAPLLPGQLIEQEREALIIEADAVAAHVISDGGEWVVASCNDKGAGLVQRISKDSPRRRLTPRVPRLGQRWIGHYYAAGRYGDFQSPGNCTVLALNNFSQDDVVPNDAGDRLRRAATAHGAIFLGHLDADIDAMRDPLMWSLVAGIVLPEFQTAQEMDAEAARVRLRLRSRGLSARPVVATLTPEQPFNGQIPRACDALAIELYLSPDSRLAGWADTKHLASRRFTQAVDLTAPWPVILIAHAYNRVSDWSTDALEAMCAETIRLAEANPLRVAGIWHFAYARPGGVLERPRLLEWHTALAAAVDRPLVGWIDPLDAHPQEPEEPSMIVVKPGKFTEAAKVGDVVFIDFTIESDARVTSAWVDLIRDGKPAVIDVAARGETDLVDLRGVKFVVKSRGSLSFSVGARNSKGEENQSSKERTIEVQ